MAIRGDRIAAVGRLGDRRRRPASHRRARAGRRARVHRHALAFRHDSARGRRRPEQGPPGRHHRDPRRGHLGRARQGEAPRSGSVDARRQRRRTWTTLGGYFDALEAPRDRGERRQLRRARHPAGLRPGRLARPARPRPARGDEGAPRRGDARRRHRALDHARQPPRAGRHDRRPRRAVPRGQAARRASTRRTSATRGPRSSRRSRRPSPSAGAPAFPSTSSTSRSPTSRSGAAWARSSR